ncbi:MAG: DsbA family protein [Caulobacter sp.]|nr:DsbA family protein [Caulobacter sp.]
MRPLIIAAAVATLLSACGQPQTAAQVDPAFGAKVRAYLLANPEVLVEVSNALKIKQSREAIGAYRQQLERDPRDHVLNPSGKVTVVVLFDYNCGYCKVIAPEVLELARTHPQVRFVFKDMVIFGDTSAFAAAATALAKSPEQYIALHRAFMAAKPLNNQVAERIMTAQGVDPAAARTEQASSERKRYFQDVHVIASGLGIEGTPAFIIGDTLIPGADPDALKAAIAAELRKKG